MLYRHAARSWCGGRNEAAFDGSSAGPPWGPEGRSKALTPTNAIWYTVYISLTFDGVEMVEINLAGRGKQVVA